MNWIIVILVLIIILSLFSTPSYLEHMSENNQSNDDIILVIARYKEDLAWLENEPYNQFKHIIYNKGTDTKFHTNKHTMEIIDLPNVGKCDHTYIYDIIRRYDILSNITLFLPGSMDIEFKDNTAKHIIKSLQSQKTPNSTMLITNYQIPIYKSLGDFEINVWETSSRVNKDTSVDAETQQSTYRPFSKWYKHHFGNLNITNVSYYGIMAVSQNHIHNRPKSFYENLITELNTSPNPEVGHYFERAWIAIFNPMDGLVHA